MTTYRAPSSLSLSIAVREHHTSAVLYELAHALQDAHERIEALEKRLEVLEWGKVIE